MIISSGSQFSVPSSISDVAVFGTKRSSGTFGFGGSANIRTSTGYVAVVWWDGVTTVYGTGNPVNSLSITKAISSPYNTSAEKLFTFYSCDSSGRRKGWIKGSTFSVDGFTQISSCDLSKCRSIEDLEITSTAITSYVHNKNLINLKLISSSITSSVNLTGSSKLTTLYMQCESVPSIDITGTNLYGLEIYGCPVSSIAGLSSVASKLTYANMIGNSITSLDFSNFTQLQNLILNYNSFLSSIRAANVSINLVSYSSYSAFYGGIALTACNLNAAALNQLYTDLASGNGVIRVDTNPGVGSDNPSIATNKGYSVLGS